MFHPAESSLLNAAAGVLAGRQVLGVREHESILPVGQALTAVGELSWEPRGRYNGAGVRVLQCAWN